MKTSALAFLAGIILLQFLPHSPNCLLLGTMTAALGLGFRVKGMAILFFFLLGMFWAELNIEHIKNWSLPKSLENKPVLITGEIASLPETRQRYASFLFSLQSLNNQPQQALIKLLWDAPHPNIQVGDTWHLQVRLKRPHGLANPGGFDYEKWLFAHGIRATGSVVGQGEKGISRNFHPIEKIRAYLQLKMEHYLANESTLGFIEALSIGSQSRITSEQWQVLRATGTNHLMAIAGVHIGFVGGFIYFISKRLWRCFPRLLLKMPAPKAAAIFSLCACLIYSALAGFSLPTQRALIMMSLALTSLFLHRHVKSWQIFFIALWAVLIWDPLSTLSVSFWLSFGAVAAILYGMEGRFRPRGLWWKWGRIQWVITVALVPLSITLFQQTSLISLLANLIAVPAVGFLVLPFCLLGTLCLGFSGYIGSGILWASAKTMTLVWSVLTHLAHTHAAIWEHIMPNMWVLAATLVAVILLLAPKGWPSRWLACIWFFPLVFYKPPHPKEGEMWFSVLDVGQGLSAVVQTSQHVLVYDTGAKIADQFDAGESVVLPFLQVSGISHIDTLLISHGDNDHSGGAQTVLKHVPVKQILTSAPERFRQKNVFICEKGQHWDWDGVHFSILYPPKDMRGLDNNSSCVLRIENGQHSVLLTGDIEKLAEDYLIKNQLLTHAEFLVAPHHGSKTSSTPEFVREVAPQYVFFPVGYLNRYHFPSFLVMKRYQQMHAKLYDTAESGALWVALGASDNIIIHEARKEPMRFWCGGG